MNIKSQPHEFHNFLHTATLVEDYLRNKLSPLGLGNQQARVIIGLDHMGEVSQARMAREFNITAASMSTMIKRLETAGFISRRKDPLNSKINLISLTERGAALVIQIFDVWDGVDAYLASKIGDEQFKTFSDIALSLRVSLGGKRPGES